MDVNLRFGRVIEPGGSPLIKTVAQIQIASFAGVNSETIEFATA